MTKEELAYYFVTTITRKTSEQQMYTAYQALCRLEQEGWALEDIKAEMDEFAQKYPEQVINIYHIEEILRNKKPKRNLILPHVFYYHNALRKPRKPPIIRFNEETKTFERIEEPFSLEMKTRFTIDDLLDYWYQSNNLQANEHMRRKDQARFEYLLQHYDIDHILFMIDEAQIDRKVKRQKPLTDVFRLEKYEEKAKEALERKRNISRIEGVDRVIPRR